MRKAFYLIGLFLLATALFAADPFVGTWKINLAKSTGTGITQNAKLVVIENGENLQGNLTGGTGIKYEYPKAGGQGRVSGDEQFDGLFVKNVSDHSRDMIYSKAGKLIRTTHLVVGQDGKSMTVSSTWKAPEGHPLQKRVYDKE